MLYNWPSNICASYFYLLFHFHLQSSALGFLLARKHFTNPLVAVPSAVSVVCMAVGVFLTLAQTYCFHFLQALAFVFFFLGNLPLPILLIHSISPLQLGGSALAVFWRNSPIPVDDKDDFKEWKFFLGLCSWKNLLATGKPFFHTTQYQSGSHNKRCADTSGLQITKLLAPMDIVSRQIKPVRRDLEFCEEVNGKLRGCECLGFRYMFLHSIKTGLLRLNCFVSFWKKKKFYLRRNFTKINRQFHVVEEEEVVKCSSPLVW